MVAAQGASLMAALPVRHLDKGQREVVRDRPLHRIDRARRKRKTSLVALLRWRRIDPAARLLVGKEEDLTGAFARWGVRAGRELDGWLAALKPRGGVACGRGVAW
jgi:hypothetical protein